MKNQTIDEDLLRSYLLGKLSDPQLSEIEDRYFVDDDYYELFLSIEDNLIDDYLSGNLNPRDRDFFETRYLVTKERHEKVEFAKDLRNVIVAHKQDAVPEHQISKSWMPRLFELVLPEKPIGEYAFAVIATIILLGNAWLIIRGIQSISELDLLKNENKTLSEKHEKLSQQIIGRETRNEQLGEQFESFQHRITLQDSQIAYLTERLESERRQRLQLEGEFAKLNSPGSAIAYLELNQGRSRSPEEKKIIEITEGMVLLQLKLPLDSEADYGIYRAELQDRKTNEILLNQNDLPYTKNAVIWQIPTSLIPAGEYKAKLYSKTSSGEDDSDYYFTIVKK